MQTIVHTLKDQKIAEIISEDIIIHTARDAIDMMMDFTGEGIYRVILHEKSISPDFFELKTKIAGDMMQAMVNYHLHAAIIGNFKNTGSESLDAFIFECNKGRHLFFTENQESALKYLS